MKVNHRMATRMKNSAKKANRAAVTGSYQCLAFLCAHHGRTALALFPVAEVEVSNSSFVAFSFRETRYSVVYSVNLS